MDNLRRLTEIIRVERGVAHHITDIVVQEITLDIVVNDYLLSSLSCIADKRIELGIGFLFSEGLLTNKNELQGYLLCDKGIRLTITCSASVEKLESFLNNSFKVSGCGGGIAGKNRSIINKPFTESLPVKLNEIPDLMYHFQGFSQLFKETGGIHSAALCQKSMIINFAEDIGRHNAVDKVIGEAILQEKRLSDYYLIVSGRISSEIVRKAIQVQIPLIVSQAAPTSKALDLAWQSGIYVIGFARGKRFNIYTGLEQIDFASCTRNAT